MDRRASKRNLLHRECLLNANPYSIVCHPRIGEEYSMACDREFTRQRLSKQSSASLHNLTNRRSSRPEGKMLRKDYSSKRVLVASKYLPDGLSDINEDSMQIHPSNFYHDTSSADKRQLSSSRKLKGRSTGSVQSSLKPSKRKSYASISASKPISALFEAGSRGLHKTLAVRSDLR